MNRHNYVAPSALPAPFSQIIPRDNVASDRFVLQFAILQLLLKNQLTHYEN